MLAGLVAYELLTPMEAWLGWLGYLIDILRYTMCFFFSSHASKAYTVTSCSLGQEQAASSATHRSHVETAVEKECLVKIREVICHRSKDNLRSRRCIVA